MPSPAHQQQFCWPCAVAPAAPTRRALLLSYYAPPHPSIATRRTEALYRWLREYGWEPIVLTVRRDGAPDDFIQTPDPSRTGKLAAQGQQAFSGSARKSPDWVNNLILTAKRLGRAWPPLHDDYVAWGQSILPTALEIGRERKVDLVWTTCSPFSLSVTAAQVAEALGVPCVVDLRDPLAEHLQYTRGQGHWFYRNLRHAGALTLATTSCATPALWRAWGDRPLAPILSGMWETERVPAQASDYFTILHAGTLYEGQRDPGPLFQAVAQLARDLPDFRRDARIRLVGLDSAAVTANPRFAPVAELCELIGQTPYQEIRTMMAAAATLLILMGDEWYLRDAVPAKLFDYLPFAAPVLAIGGQRGMLAELLAWAGCGTWASTPDAIAEVLHAHYVTWKTTGHARAPRHPDALEYLTQQRMAAECAEVFNATVEGRPITCWEHPPWEA